MKVIDRENDPEVLREFVKLIIARNEELHAENTKLRDEISQKKQLKLNIEDELLKLKKLLFKKGRERRVVEATDRPRTIEEESILLHSQSLVPAPKNNQKIPLSEEVIYHEMTDRELMRESKLRGIATPNVADWEKVENFYDEASEITLIERKYVKLRHRRQKYKLKQNIGADKEVIITAPGPAKLIPGSSYSIDFAVGVVSDKYINHIPLERQCRQMASLGLMGMTPKTLYNLSSFIAAHLEGIAENIKGEIFSGADNSSVHVDETPWPINNSKQDNGYMWTLSNRAGAYYRFESTRSGEIARELLEGYKGAVLTDGYRGYNKVKSIEGVTLSYCWAHVRRKFIEIEPNYPEECKEILDLIDKLFVIERQAKDFSELKILRNEKSEVIIGEIAMWLINYERSARKESGLKKAIDYALKLWPGLKSFIGDVRVPLTNNDAERAIRHAVMGRKNFYGSRTINGADVAATLYTVIESCKRAEVDPRDYIQMAVTMSARGEDPITPLWVARAKRTGMQYPPQ